MADFGFNAKFSLDTQGFASAMKEVKRIYDKRARRAILLGSLLYVAEIKKELSQPGTGRARKVKGKKGIRGGTTASGRARVRIASSSNRASAPGNPPAVDTGRLRASITKDIAKVFNGWVATVGSNVEYAAILHFGGHTGKNNSTFIEARPYMLAPLVRIQAKLLVIFARELRGG